MPAKIYYDRDREHYLKVGRDYYNNNREYILKKARDKYNNSEEDKNKRIEYCKNRYHKMCPEKKLELKIIVKKIKGNMLILTKMQSWPLKNLIFS